MIKILGSASSNCKGLFFENFNFQPVGKVILEALNFENFKEFDKKVTLYLKFKHTPFKINTKTITIRP